MPYSAYKILHVLGIAMLLVSLGGAFVHAAGGASLKAIPARRLVLILHGIGSVLILVAGFGLLAKLGPKVAGFPAWLVPKILVWLALSAGIRIAYRSAKLARSLLIVAPLLVLLAACFAIFKPI